jgi:HNH endonuclease
MAKPADRFPDFARWMKEKGYAKQSCHEYPYFLDRYVTAFKRPIDASTVSTEGDVQNVLADVKRAQKRGGRGAGEFNEHDPRNLQSTLRLFVQFVQEKGVGTNGNDFPNDALPPRIRKEISRIVRDTAASRQLKELYDFSCQICGETLMLDSTRKYAEVHHIQPLGKTGGGPDRENNMICVCPNHHALLDFAAIPLEFSKLKLTKHRLRDEFVIHHNARVRSVL